MPRALRARRRPPPGLLTAARPGVAQSRAAATTTSTSAPRSTLDRLDELAHQRSLYKGVCEDAERSNAGYTLSFRRARLGALNASVECEPCPSCEPCAPRAARAKAAPSCEGGVAAYAFARADSDESFALDATEVVAAQARSPAVEQSRRGCAGAAPWPRREPCEASALLCARRTSCSAASSATAA